MKTVMTVDEAMEWVYEQDDSELLQSEKLEAAFTALAGRPPNDYDWQIGLWSLCCSMTPNCGTRPL